jgi:hypothetical protein
MVRAEGSERAGLRQAGRGGLEGCYRRSLWKTHKRARGRLAPDEAGYAKSAMRRPGRGGSSVAFLQPHRLRLLAQTLRRATSPRNRRCRIPYIEPYSNRSKCARRLAFPGAFRL